MHNDDDGLFPTPCVSVATLDASMCAIGWNHVTCPTSYPYIPVVFLAGPPGSFRCSEYIGWSAVMSHLLPQLLHIPAKASQLNPSQAFLPSRRCCNPVPFQFISNQTERPTCLIRYAERERNIILLLRRYFIPF